MTIGNEIKREVPEQHFFHLSDGGVIRSIYDLVGQLESMDETVFSQHVTESKNDFANWVSEVVGEQELANELRNTTSRIETQLKVLRHTVSKVLE